MDARGIMNPHDLSPLICRRPSSCCQGQRIQSTDFTTLLSGILIIFYQVLFTEYYFIRTFRLYLSYASHTMCIYGSWLRFRGKGAYFYAR